MLSTEEIEARRFAARKRELVERVLPVVEAMLERGGGYANITVDEIAKQSGMARSSFYRYFSDKHDLLIALGAPALEAIREAAMRPWEMAPDVTREGLAEELLRTMEDYRPHTPLLAAIIEASTYDATAREYFLAGFDQIRDGVAAHIEAGQEQGFIYRDIHPREMAGWITWMAERGMSALVAEADEATLRRLADSLAAIVWRAIYDGHELTSRSAESATQRRNR